VKRIIGKTVPESMEMAQFQAFRADMSYRMELSDGVPTIRFKLGDQQCRLQAWEVSAKLLTFMHEV
jgi:hypothetical protein